MTNSNIPIDRLRLKYECPEGSGGCNLPTKGMLCQKRKSHWFKLNKSIGEYILWFVIFSLFFFFVFYFWLPSFFRNDQGDPDNIKIFLVSIGLAFLLILLLAWLKFI